MSWRFIRRAASPGERAGAYFVTFRMQTGAGKLEAKSHTELSQLLGDLRLAGASDITVVDDQGRLVSFEPGS